MAEETLDGGLSTEDLKAELVTLENDYKNLKIDHFIRGLGNPMMLRSFRRDIARIKTELRSREIAEMSQEELENRSKIRKRRRRQRRSKK